MKGLPSVERAIAIFSRFPGIGKKSAGRMIYHLLRYGQRDIEQLLHSLQELRDRVKTCRICHNLAEGDICWVCEDNKRDRSLLCVLEEASDLMAFEKAGFFRGTYHVLGGRLNPLDDVGPEQLNMGSLEKRLLSGEIKELVIATNPTVEGEATAHFVAQLANSTGCKVTRLAYGLPMGGELEYLDESTLYQALAGRREF
ncbi:MAG: recombination protein RecR [Magnetococcales bacterium]|nr:recombination protein RecR [Magnetococcales bacterium]